MMIRTAAESDLDEIVVLWKEFMDYHAGLDEAFIRSTDGHEHYRTLARGYIEDGNTLALVAVEDGLTVGFSFATILNNAGLVRHNTYGFIGNFAVTENCRRRGIGAAMYREIIHWFKANGVERVELRVSARNDAAGAFWREMGFGPYLETLSREI